MATPKTYRLEKRIGLKGVRSLQILWCWCAQNRPDGNLADLDAGEIEFVADWRGKKGSFVEACVYCGWLDKIEDGFNLHEWADYNPYQAQAGSRAEARKEKARNAANARWGKERHNDANGCSSDANADAQNATSICSNDAQAYANECSSDATSNAQKMPSLTLTHTKDIKGNFKPPPISPQGEREGLKQEESQTSPETEKPPKFGTGVPSIEFQELREFWDKEMRCEGPLAGFREYKTLKKARDHTGMSCWPGLGVILNDVEQRKSAHIWNPGYEIGLGRYLTEKTWLAPVVSRASPLARRDQNQESENERAARATWQHGMELIDEMEAKQNGARC